MVKREFVEERHRNLLTYIELHKRVEVPELAKEFNVTEVTIRRDLILLEKQKRIIRTHGGAISLQNRSIWETTKIGVRQDKMKSEKQAIAEYAASCINDGDSLFIDSGSTTLEVTKILATNKHHLMVVTNGPLVAQTLAGVNDNQVILAGGILHKDTDAIIGVDCCQFLKRFRTDKAILGISGIRIPDGYFAAIPDESATKKIMLENAEFSIIVCDSSKIDANAFSFTAGLNAPSLLVIDEGITKEQQSRLVECGVHIQVVRLHEEKTIC